MAAKIRLKKMGRTGIRSFRIVIADESDKRDGKVVEELGYYEPKANPAKLEIDKKRLEYWVSKGATPTDTVRKILSL
jgi:small subunit ribosomal protein S16